MRQPADCSPPSRFARVWCLLTAMVMCGCRHLSFVEIMICECVDVLVICGIKALSVTVMIINELVHNLPLSVLKMLYLTLIQPYFEYCNIVWAVHKSTALNDLIICQKKAIRIITNSKWNTHTKPLFYNTRILPIDKLNDLGYMSHVLCIVQCTICYHGIFVLCLFPI